MTYTKREAPAAATVRASEPTNHQERGSTMSISSDQLFRDHHLASAAFHIERAIVYTEGLAAEGGADIGRRYAQRSELRVILDTLRDLKEGAAG